MTSNNNEEPTFEELLEANRELEHELELVDTFVNEFDKSWIKEKATGDQIIDAINQMVYNRSVYVHGEYLANKYKFQVIFLPKHLKKGARQWILHLAAGSTILITIEGNPVDALQNYKDFIHGMTGLVGLFPKYHREASLVIMAGKSVAFDSFSEIRLKLKKAKESWLEDSDRLIPDFRLKNSYEVTEIKVTMADTISKLSVSVKGCQEDRKDLELQARILLTKKVREWEIERNK